MERKLPWSIQTQFVSQARGLVTFSPLVQSKKKSARLHPVQAEIPSFSEGNFGFFFLKKKTAAGAAAHSWPDKNGQFSRLGAANLSSS
jgi:hypothetical protein